MNSTIKIAAKCVEELNQSNKKSDKQKKKKEGIQHTNSD